MALSHLDLGSICGLSFTDFYFGQVVNLGRYISFPTNEKNGIIDATVEIYMEFSGNSKEEVVLFWGTFFFLSCRHNGNALLLLLICAYFLKIRVFLNMIIVWNGELTQISCIIQSEDFIQILSVVPVMFFYGKRKKQLSLGRYPV